MLSNATLYRGRFAPSPTGPLHFGSIVTAIASYLEARTRGGEWLVRIENLDFSREVAGAAERILNTLDALGMQWDGEVLYQDQRSESYRAAFAVLERQRLVYPCACSRKEIADSSVVGTDGPIYSGICRTRSFAENHGKAWRVKTDNDVIEFRDRLQGCTQQRVESSVGDFVLRRADGIFAYQLAVVVDDAEQGITHVVRGADLLGSTPRQIYLQKLLGYPTPGYMHVPVATNRAGEKLSKQTHAAPFDVVDPMPNMVMALNYLGQNPPQELLESDLQSFWKWALENWRAEQVPPVEYRISENINTDNPLQK